MDEWKDGKLEARSRKTEVGRKGLWLIANHKSLITK